MRQISLIMLIAMALVAVQTRRLRNAVIYLGVFSLCSSFVFLLYHAPDVAIAEAVIGSTLSTILYMVALRKHRVFTMYYRAYSGTDDRTYGVRKTRLDFIRVLEKFCEKQGLEPHIIFTSENREAIMEAHDFSVIIEAEQDDLVLYGSPENCQIDAIAAFLQDYGTAPHPYRLVKCEVVE